MFDCSQDQADPTASGGQRAYSTRLGKDRSPRDSGHCSADYASPPKGEVPTPL